MVAKSWRASSPYEKNIATQVLIPPSTEEALFWAHLLRRKDLLANMELLEPALLQYEAWWLKMEPLQRMFVFLWNIMNLKFARWIPQKIFCHICNCIFIHIHLHIEIYICICTYIYIYMFISICKYIYIYTPARSRNDVFFLFLFF